MYDSLMSQLSLNNKIWFSPLNVIHHFKKLEAEGIALRSIQQAVEETMRLMKQ
jgi:hypothetical protein